MDGQVIVGTKLDTKSFDKQIKEVEYQLEQLDYELSHAKELKLDSRTIKEYELKAEKLTNQLASLRKKQEDLNTTNLSGISTQLSNIGNGVESVIKKVTRWGLALFGIRSIYSFIRSSMSALSGYNEQLATDVEYIRFALATTLQPVIERIIQLVYTLLQYIGYIAKAWFGVNIFANATVEAFQKQKKAITETNKQAKELQKTLAGFDEMNILQENGSVTSGGGGGGISTPSVNLSEIAEIDNMSGIETWLKKAKDKFNKTFDDIKINVEEVMKNLGFSQDYIDACDFTAEGIKKIFNGLGKFIFGFGQTIVGLLTGDTDLIKKGFENMGGGIKKTFEGILQTIIGIFTQIIVFATDTFKKLPELIYNLFIKKGDKSFEDFKNETQRKFKNMIDNITRLFANFGTTVGNVLGKAFKSVINGVLRTIENILNTPIRTINTLISTINKLPGVNIGRLPTFSLPRLAKGTIANAPGKGVLTPSGNAIYGEAGREAYLPLDDTRLLEELGSTIGRYITINANITNTMNGRVISREIQRVQNNSNFAFKINNVSMAPYLVQIEFGRNKLWGPDTGRNLRGKTTGTFLGIVNKYKLTFRKLTQQELELLAPILDSAWQSTYAYDPILKQYVTIETYTGDWATLNKSTFTNVAKANESFDISVIATEPRLY